jgi:hypothetical protein
MGFKEWIIPQDRVFYDLLEHYADHVQKTVAFFEVMLRDWTSLEERRQELKGLEHQADEISHEIFHRLGRTFITPLDREDIAGLAHTLDDIVDYVDAAGNRMALFDLAEPDEAMRKFTDILRAQVEQLVPAVKALRKPSARHSIKKHTIEVHRLENEADRLLNRSIAALFQTNDPIRILKLKDIYENLETATDRCEDVADILNDILRKQG